MTALPAKETLAHLIRRALATPRDEALVERVDGRWTPMSSGTLLEHVENVACAIRASGLSAGDRVALIAHDCVDWIVTDFAVLLAGCVVVPIYPTQALDQTAFILRHSGAKLLVVGSAAIGERTGEAGEPLPPVVTFGDRGAGGFAAFEALGARVRAEHPELPAAYEAAQVPDDLAVLIYTSGTTGDPKGVMLSHDNVAFNAQAALVQGFSGIDEGSNVISALPYSHIYEHTIVYIYLLAKVRYFICHDPANLVADLLDVHPVGMTAVPRLFDRVIAGVEGHALLAGGLQAKLVPWALRTGRDYMRAKTFGGGPSAWLSLQYAIASNLVLRKVRARLGLDRMKLLESGSAALHLDTAMTFLGMGIPIMQGYGLTETSPVIACSNLNENQWGAVGRALPGVELRIAGDGEVLTRGRHVMLGYYRDPEATAQTIDAEGWLHTGDIGEIDARGFLRITDRKREVFKTDTGKWIAPGRVEASIKRSIYVAQAMVVGDGRPHPIAMICPNWELVRFELRLPTDASAAELAARDDVREFLEGEVLRQTGDLAKYEQIRRVVVIPNDFTVESGELSPSMKVKRRVVGARYALEIAQAYTRGS